MTNRETPLLRLILVSILSIYGACFSFAQEKIPGEILHEAEEQIVELMDAGDIPGASVILIKGDQQLVMNYGYADLSAKQPVTSETLFEIGSCSKAFTAMAVIQLQQRGIIDFKDPVSEYIPWFRVLYNNSVVNITIEHLLHHTSGIPWSTLATIPQSDATDALEQTVKGLVEIELDELPGEKFQYATINYDVLALIVEKVLGQPFEKYLQYQVIDKLSLLNTSVGKPRDSSLMAVGYKIGFFKAREYDAPVYKGNNAAGYVISNAEDMKAWLSLQMGLSNSAMFELAKVSHERDKTVPLHGMSAYAKGWEVALDGSGEVYHGGLNPNFSSYVAFRPSEKLGVAVLTNSNSSYTTFMGNRLMKLLAGEEIKKEIDPGDGNDKAYSGISIALMIYVIVVMGFLFMMLFEAFKGKRSFEMPTWRKLSRFILTGILISPFVLGLYLLPKALFGFTWEAILVWSPLSFGVLIGCIVISIITTYFIYFISLFLPDSNKYKRKLPQILLISILSGLSNVVVIIMVTSAIDSDVQIKYLVFYYLLTLSLYLMGRRFVQVNLIKLTRGLVYDLRIKLIDKMFSTSYENFERMDRGRVYTALNDDVNTIGQSTNLFITLVTSVITSVGAFIYLASISFWATMLTIFLVVTLATLYYFAVQSTNVYFEEARDSRNVFMALINGMIDGFKEISLHRGKKLEYKNDIALSAEEYRKKISTADIRFVNAFLVGESLLVVLLGVVSIGMSEVFPNVQYYTIMSFVIVLLYLIGPVNGILNSVPVLMNLRIAWNRVSGFMKEIPANLDLSKVPKSRFEKVHKLEVRGVEYSFHNENEEENNFSVGPINLEVSSGEILFLIGGNGSGKTTLAKLLTGLYEPDRGVVMINNKVLKNAELSEYFSTVFSPPYLFEKLYSVDLKDRTEELHNYLRLLDLEQKVAISENQYSTINLSSGQRKRLALLQCYLEDSPIYLFDEWAADQDPDYRNFFYKTLLPEMKLLGKIVIAITHDDHYFHLADKILKMDRGKLKVYSDHHTLKEMDRTV
ncbi:MAG: cyclic peptide export ABC transporter [Fulvivirga sp.]